MKDIRQKRNLFSSKGNISSKKSNSDLTNKLICRSCLADHFCVFKFLSICYSFSGKIIVKNGKKR